MNETFRFMLRNINSTLPYAIRSGHILVEKLTWICSLQIKTTTKIYSTLTNMFEYILTWEYHSLLNSRGRQSPGWNLCLLQWKYLLLICYLADKYEVTYRKPATGTVPCELNALPKTRSDFSFGLEEPCRSAVLCACVNPRIMESRIGSCFYFLMLKYA